MAASMPGWLNGRSLSDAEPSCKLTLRHLNRAHVDLLCAYEGISGSPDRAQAVQDLERHLTRKLSHDTILTPLVGLVPNCEYPTVVMPRPYELLLFGGSQAGVSDVARGRLAATRDALWHCNLLEGEWRTLPTRGATPSARSGHSAVMHDNKMWVYGGWSDVPGKELDDMHVLHIRESGMRWEQVATRGFEMEARAWHSVCVHEGRMLLYGDKGECAQSQSNMATVFAFDFETLAWGTITCTGAEHPEPQFVLAITVWSGTLYALCFTAGGRPDAAWDGANSGELHAAHPDDRGVGGGGGDEGVVEPGTPLSPMSVPNDSSCLEVFALDLETCVWRKVQVEGHMPGGRYGCSATVSAGGTWVVHGGISRCQDYILSDTYEFDFAVHRWSRVHVHTPPAPRTGHVGAARPCCNMSDLFAECGRSGHDPCTCKERKRAGIAVDDSMVFVGGNSCAPEPLPPPSPGPARAIEDHRRANLTSHGLHFPFGVNGAAPIGPLPSVYRGEGDITFSRRAEVMWQRPREPAEHTDASVCNVDLLRGVRSLAGPAESALPDVLVATADGATLPSFRVLLAASAASFRAMFSADMQEARYGTLDIDAPEQHVQWLLDYVHGALRTIEGHMARPLFQLADQYGVAGLLHACEARLIHDLSAESVPSVLELSDMHGSTGLAHACVEFVTSSQAGLQSIIGTDGFVRLMQERPQKAQSFLLQCVPAPMA